MQVIEKISFARLHVNMLVMEDRQKLLKFWNKDRLSACICTVEHI